LENALGGLATDKIVELPAPAETTDASTGITTIISYKRDENGKTIKVSCSIPTIPPKLTFRLRDESGERCRPAWLPTRLPRGRDGPSTSSLRRVE
jgi:hypothetical protein